MVDVLDSKLNSLDSSLSYGITLCSRERHFTVLVLLSTQVYKWLLVSFMLVVNL